MINPLKDWKDKWDNLPQDSTGSSGPDAVGSLIDSMVKNMEFGSPMGGTPSFTYNSDAFIAKISGLSASDKKEPGSNAFANGFAAAVQASTMNPAGTYVGAPTPATTFATGSATPNAASLSAAKSKLLDRLLKDDAKQKKSLMPDYLYEAFTSIKYDITGVNQLSFPLSVPGVPVK